MKAKKLIAVRLPLRTIGKLKHIVWYDRTTFTDKVNVMAQSEIEKFEKANGIITEDQIKWIIKKS